MQIFLAILGILAGLAKLVPMVIEARTKSVQQNAIDRKEQKDQAVDAAIDAIIKSDS